MRLNEEWREGEDDDCVVGAILMDLSKAFNCISHGLIIANVAANGLNFDNLKLIFSYLQGWQQCVKIINIQNNLSDIISGVPQGSPVEPILLNISSNDFYFIENASIHNYADGNNLSSAWARTLSDVIKVA